MGISDSKLNQDLIERYKLTTKARSGGIRCTPNVGQLCPDLSPCPPSGICPGGGPAPPPPPGPPSPAGDAGWCNKNLNCAPGTQCCQLNSDKKGCAPMGTTEAECRGTWHPIGPTNPCEGKTRQNCNNHGTPTKSADEKSCPCVCDDGWDGDDCSLDVDPCSPNPCQNGGTCVVVDDKTHTCDCPPDYVGDNCEFPTNNCNGHGTVDPQTGDCKCDGTYAGSNCQYSDKETCNNHGTAQDDGSCICKDGYSGDNCEISDTYVCVAPPKLNVEGSVAPGLLANGANVGDSLGDNARCIPASVYDPANQFCKEDADGKLPNSCYPSKAECESSCTGNYSCQLTGDCKLDPKGGFPNAAECEAKCGDSYICNNNQCKIQSGPCKDGKANCYPTQADCDATCQNHYECINNTCESKAGAAQGPTQYSTLKDCEATGCGKSSFACINDLCTKVDDPPDAGKGRYATQADCDDACGNSFTCSEKTNRCVQHKGQVPNSSSSLADCQASGCGEFHYECDDGLGYCVRKFGKANGAGQFETEDACDQACKNSFGCIDGECIQYPGPSKPKAINKYDTHAECTADGCGNVTYDCAGVGMCIEVPGNDGNFKTEAACDEICANSFGCLQNQCVQFAGSADPNGDNKFKSLAECQAEGCGKFYYLCEDQKDGGGVVVGQKCVRYEGSNPPAGVTAYASEVECNANCSNTFNCNNNVCEEIVGDSGKFDTRQSCEESGCGEMSYKCVNNLSCVKMNKPVDQDDPNDFFTQEECDIKCGNKFECDTTVNRCVEAPGAQYGDLRSCQQEGCGQVYYECKNNQFCEKKNGAKPQQGKVFDSELQCDANCGNSFDCVQNTCIQITGRDGEFATEQECELHGCGKTYFSCLGEAGKQRCVENIGSNPGGAGNFDTKSECDASCENSFNCDKSDPNNIRCVQVTGRQGKFQSLRQCQDDGCGKHYYQCDGEMCKKINDKFPANPGLDDFRTEGECDASCGNSFDCVNNVCTQYPGEKTGPYKSLKECEERGCGDTHFSCIGKRCIEQKGPGTDADYKSRAECDARCGNSFKCSTNGKCVELDGGLGKFDSLAECEASECEEKYYECKTNPQDPNQKFCVEIQGSNPGGPNQHDTEIECDIACGNSFDCVGNKCEQLSTTDGQFKTQAECEAQGCGKTTYNCDGSRCIPISGSSGTFETEAACDAVCNNSYDCVNNQCIQYPGNIPGLYPNLAACQAGGCGQYHYECTENPQNPNQKICTKEVGPPQAGKNHYESELECDIACGVSFDCVDNECKQFSGKNVGPYKTMRDCESAGCGKTSFKCLDNMCVEVEGEDGGYSTENACDLGCGNSFDCENNTCVQIKGNTGQYNTLAQCQSGGCGKVTYTCETVRGGGKMCKVVKGAQAGEYESELACDSGCGNSFDCVQNECIERADTNGQFSTHLECEQNGCGVVTYTCTGKRCVKEDGPHGAFQTEDECDALCGNSFDCENNKCVQKTGADGQYNTLAQCENSVCEESYWYCDPDKKICTKMFGQKQGSDGEYDTEMECNAACGNSYGCVQNQCQQFSGPPVAGEVNQYQTREQCEQNGCGSTHFSCVNNLCLEFPGAPSKASDFATREECDATCGNSFRCDSVTHQCVQKAGAPQAGEFKTLAQCELDGCEDTYWECEDNQQGQSTTCIKKWGMKPQGAQYHSSEDACEANCGGSYDCVQNSCVERIGDQGEYKTQAECVAVGCGSTSFDCKNNQCVERPGSGGAYPTQNDCDMACGNSFGCDTATHKCTEYPGQPNAAGPNKYGTLLQCEADGCEDSYYLCEDNINGLSTCTKMFGQKQGLDGEYDTEMECNAKCGNSFGCLQNQCTQFPGQIQQDTNPYSTRQECQASGCGQTHFSCSADAQGNSLCVELDGPPQAGDFATQIECDLQCNNSFGCGAENKCVQFKGSANQQGKNNPYSSLSECQASQCGKTYFSCENNSCIEKPGSADPKVPTDFETKALCDATCGNSYGCVVDGTGAKTCTQFSGAPQFPSNPYSTMDQCRNSGCETITYNCVGGERCVLVNGPGGTYNSMAECDDACQTYYDCSEDGTTCVSKKGAGEFNSLTECQNSECGKSYFNCDGSLCTEIIGLNPKGADDYDTELACNAACGNSFDCVGGNCVQRIGPQGEFETRQQCEAAGCENITYSCRGGRCYEMIYPNVGGYQTEAECDAGCGNSYNCTGNQCTQVVGQDGDHNTLAECQASGCGTVSYVCDDNAVCREVEGNVGLCTGSDACKAVINPTKTSCDAAGAACIFHFPTIGECDAACGNSYNCGDDNTCQETFGGLGAYDTLAECQASECGKTRFNCNPQNNQCEEVPGINGTYLTQTECDAQCSNFYTCETNANNQKQCTQGTGQPPAGAYDSLEECQTSECTYGWKCTDTGCKQEIGGRYITQAACEERCHFKCDNTVGGCVQTTDSGNGTFPTRSQCEAAGNCTLWKWKCNPAGNGDCTQTGVNPKGLTEYEDKADCEARCNVKCNKALDPILGCSVDLRAQPCVPNGDDCFINMDQCVENCANYKFECNQNTGDCEATVNGTYESKDQCEQLCNFSCDASQGQCVFSEQGEFPSVADCVAQRCVKVDLCDGVDCGNGVCVPNEQARTHTCVCEPCYDPDANGSCTVLNEQDCCEANHGTWANGVCTCLPGWSKGPDGIRCTVARAKCPMGSYKTNIGKGQNDLPFDCEKCRTCSGGYQKSVECSGRGTTDTSQCVKSMQYCGTQCTPNDDCTYAGDDYDDCVSCPSGYSDAGWKNCDVGLFGWGTDHKRRCSWTRPISYTPF
jgi:hypothetical protein